VWRHPINVRSDGAARHRNHPPRKQQRLKQVAGTAGTQVIASEFFDEFLVAAHHAPTALDPRFRREALAALARHLESTRRLRRSVAWHTSLYQSL
jgi:hypothetical protein